MKNIIEKISTFFAAEKTKKVVGIISKVISWTLISIAAIMMILTIISATSISQEDKPENGHGIFGFKLFIVTSDSMSLSENNKDMKVHFKAGDIIFVKRLKEGEVLKEGEIISFISTNNENYGETVTHMIDSVVEEDGKVIGYRTYGTNTGDLDESVVQTEYIHGKYVGQIDNVGYFFIFLKSLPGYITCILIPFLLLIVYNGANVIVLFRKYRKEQMDQMQREKEYIEKEKEKNQQLLEELLKLKKELGKEDE